MMNLQQFLEKHLRANVTLLISSIMTDEYGEAKTWFETLCLNDAPAYEVWLVSAELERKLATKGEATCYFGDLNFWARRMTGQTVAMDRVILRIKQELSV